jgi:hypothetical protein
MTSAIQILTLQFADSSSKMLKILADIGDEEFFWEPCAGCWTLHRRSENRVRRPDGSDEWVLDGE